MDNYKNNKPMKILIALLSSVLLLISYNAYSLSLQEKLLFWEKTRKGANMFNKIIDQQDIKEARNFNIKFIMLALDNFPTQKRDFLIGSADKYEGLVPEDLELLKQTLDTFAQEKMPVIITMSTLPGSRHYSNNNGKEDLRIWHLEAYQKQITLFWQDLVKEIKDHPSVIGINIINRPIPEKIFINDGKKLYQINQKEVQNVLFNFYKDVITAIRKIDKNIKIIIDSSAKGNPNAFQYFIKQNTSNIIYSFHMYEPEDYTDKKRNQNKFFYPGKIDEKEWNKDKLRAYLAPVKDFQIRNRIPNSQILVSGYGCNRYALGVEHYLQDLTDIFNELGWHTAFSYFRSDINDDMDYELDDKKLPWSYYQAIESGFQPKPKRYHNSKIFKIIKEYLAK